MELSEKLISFFERYNGRTGASSAEINEAFELYVEFKPNKKPGSKNCSTCVGSVFAQLQSAGYNELKLQESRIKEEAEAESIKKLEAKSKSKPKKKAGRPKKITK